MRTLEENKVTFTDDKLNRAIIACNLKNILLSTNQNVFSINAPWGGGKTYFIENLSKLFHDEAITIIYNAWESDFYNSPLIPVLIEILSKVEQCVVKSKLEKEIDQCKEIARKITKRTSYQAGLTIFDIVNISANFDPSKKLIDSEYMELKKEIKNFKNKLMEIQEKLDKKIIIFIDELDRCNPVYAIKTLEVIKHFFGMPNILFVLSVDKKQLESSVRIVFGVNTGEENGYLRKFIDVEFELPQSNKKKLVEFHLSKIWQKIEKFKEYKRYYRYNPIREEDEEDVEFISNLINRIAQSFDLQPRDIEKFFARLNLTLDVLLKEDILFIEPVILMNALCLCQSKKGFNDFINCKRSDSYLEKIAPILPYWNGMFVKDAWKNIYSRYRNMHSVPRNTIESNVGYICENIGKKYIQNIDGGLNEYFNHYPEKIEFINNFNIENN